MSGPHSRSNSPQTEGVEYLQSENGPCGDQTLSGCGVLQQRRLFRVGWFSRLKNLRPFGTFRGCDCPECAAANSMMVQGQFENGNNLADAYNGTNAETWQKYQFVKPAANDTRKTTNEWRPSEDALTLKKDPNSLLPKSRSAVTELANKKRLENAKDLIVNKAFTGRVSPPQSKSPNTIDSEPPQPIVKDLFDGQLEAEKPPVDTLMQEQSALLASESENQPQTLEHESDLAPTPFSPGTPENSATESDSQTLLFDDEQQPSPQEHSALPTPAESIGGFADSRDNGIAEPNTDSTETPLPNNEQQQSWVNPEPTNLEPTNGVPTELTSTDSDSSLPTAESKNENSIDYQVDKQPIAAAPYADRSNLEPMVPSQNVTLDSGDNRSLPTNDEPARESLEPIKRNTTNSTAGAHDLLATDEPTTVPLVVENNRPLLLRAETRENNIANQTADIEQSDSFQGTLNMLEAFNDILDPLRESPEENSAASPMQLSDFSFSPLPRLPQAITASQPSNLGGTVDENGIDLHQLSNKVESMQVHLYERALRDMEFREQLLRQQILEYNFRETTKLIEQANIASEQRQRGQNFRTQNWSATPVGQAKPTGDSVGQPNYSNGGQSWSTPLPPSQRYNENVRPETELNPTDRNEADDSEDLGPNFSRDARMPYYEPDSMLRLRAFTMPKTGDHLPPLLTFRNVSTRKRIIDARGQRIKETHDTDVIKLPNSGRRALPIDDFDRYQKEIRVLSERINRSRNLDR